MNHQQQEHFHVSHDAIAHNARTKRKVVEDATPPLPNQASTLGVSTHVPVMNAQPRVVTQQK